MWSGLPTWSGLLEELAVHLEREGHSADLVRREIRSGDLLQAASYGVSKLTPASFGVFVRNAVRAGKVTPHAIHRAIVNLGPTSFITTNYDGLLEDALKKWRAEEYFAAPVTNKHLVELADIVSARSSHFIFKPHGDVNDISSVVLTREQYRSLMQGGERQNALETLKTLLTTRPVLYLGFGLRDPDFLYLRDLLLNIYQGAVRDHWAIMPDVDVDEIEYWRKQYGIRLLGYATSLKADGGKDHGALLRTLEGLAVHEARREEQPLGPAPLGRAERTLALTRYTSGLMRRLAPATPPIEARVSSLTALRSVRDFLGGYEGWTTTRFLLDGPDAAYLIGLPGSGKSFALRLAAHELATALHRACLEDALKETDLTLPFFIDLKLYRGDLKAQLVGELPAGVSLGDLKGKLRAKLFLDAFNEMPSEHIEGGELFKSLEQLGQEIGEFSFAISSRTTDALMERPGERSFYEIDRFDAAHVDAVLAQRGITLEGAFARATTHLLARPFFLQLVAKGDIDLPPNPSPKDLFASYIFRIERDFSAKFETSVALMPVFSRIAYRAIEAESEAFPLAWLSDALAAHIPTGAVFGEADIVNWLVAREFLIPYTGRRASFVHQSITEYCAATELARRSRRGDLPVRDIVSAKKWDQCLFLALSLMERRAADRVLGAIIELDMRLAVNAARYAEDAQSEAVTRVLQALINSGNAFRTRLSMGMPLKNLPVGEEHVPLLKELLSDGGILAGEAVGLIAEVLGSTYKSELLDLLAAHRDDYNFAVNGIAPALAPLLSDDDLPKVLEIAKRNVAERRGSGDGSDAIGTVLAKFAPERLAPLVRTPNCPPGTIEVIARALSEREDEASLALLGELLLAAPTRVASNFALALSRLGRRSPTSLGDLFDGRHVEAVWSARFESVLWYSALQNLCKASQSLRNAAELIVPHFEIERIALMYCVGAEKESIFGEVEKLVEQSEESLSVQPLEIFHLADLDWSDRGGLLWRSLGRSDMKLRESLLQKSYNYIDLLPAHAVGIDKMLPLLQQLEAEPASEEAWWLRHRLGELVAHQGDAGVRDYCIRGLREGSRTFKEWVKASYIGEAGVTTDALDEAMISTLLADLTVPGRIQEFWYNPLGHIATERFVMERLLPLAENASTEFRDNLSIVLQTAGNRHKKRYLLPS